VFRTAIDRPVVGPDTGQVVLNVFHKHSRIGPLRDLVTVVLAMGTRSERRRVCPRSVSSVSSPACVRLPPRSRG
jgi:hypothetical protein